MQRIEIQKKLTEHQSSRLNNNHLTGFQFLKNAGSELNQITDDYFSKVEKLGKLVIRLDGLRIKAKERGILTSFEFKNSNNPKAIWTELEKLGFSVMMPSERTIEANEAKNSNLVLISKESLSAKDLEIISKVGFVLKETQLIESLLLGKSGTPGASAIPPKETVKENNKERSWEKDLYPASKKRSW
jgi:transposase